MIRSLRYTIDRLKHPVIDISGRKDLAHPREAFAHRAGTAQPATRQCLADRNAAATSAPTAASVSIAQSSVYEHKDSRWANNCPIATNCSAAARFSARAPAQIRHPPRRLLSRPRRPT